MIPESTRLEGQLWQAAGRGFEQLFRSASAHDVIRMPGGMLAMTGVAAPDFNAGVVWASDDAAAVTLSLGDELRRRGLPGILLVADSAGHDPNDAAARAGMIAAARMPLMTHRPQSAAVESRFSTRRATSPSDLSAANQLVAAAFELPIDQVDAAFRPPLLESNGVSVELVVEGDVPVGCLQTTSSDGLMGIWSMATPPAQRRRGIARAGLSYVLAERCKVIANLAFLIATDAGRPLYAALGFEVVAWATAWVVAAPD